MTLEAGELVLGRYRIEALLGRGGMGEVYRARHARLGLEVAVKILSEVNDEMVRRFEREATLMARVRHPNVVAIADFGQTESGLPCIVMEFIRGEELGARLRRCGALPWPEALAVVRGMLSGLDAMHAAQVLHRDLKPENIVIAPGEPEVVKLIDFGIAKPTDGRGGGTRLTSSGNVIGTPAYMAPEQLLGFELDVRADLYTVGLIFFELISGKLPGDGQEMSAVLDRLKSEPLPPRAPAELPHLPKKIGDVIVSLLQAARERRPATARAVLTSLSDKALAEAPMGEAAHPAFGMPPYGSQLPPHPAGWVPPGYAQPGWGPPSGVAPHGIPNPSGAFGSPPRPGGLPEHHPSPWPQGVAGQHVSQWSQPAPPGAVMPSGYAYPPPGYAVAPGWPGGAPAAWPPGWTQQGAPAGYGQPPAAAPIQSLQVAALSQPMMRFVLVARLPPSRLALAEERRWLSGFMGSLGRGFSLGAGLWFGVQSAPAPASDAQVAADGLIMRLSERYGGVARLACRLVDEGFSLSPAQLTGAQPLPQELVDLLESVSSV